MYKGKGSVDIIGYIFFILFLYVANTILTSVSERGHEDKREKIITQVTLKKQRGQLCFSVVSKNVYVLNLKGNAYWK